MLMSRLPSPIAPTSEQGFTLVELLVAMMVSIVVLGAILATVEFALREQTSIAARVDADQIGRGAMTSIINELHSSCTGFGATAIQAPSPEPTSPLASTGAADLWFISSYGNASSEKAVLSGVTEHDIHWVSTGKSTTTPVQTLGTLTDYSFASTGGTSPNWQFPELTIASATTKRVLATNVIPTQVAGVSTIFQYYKYNNTGQLLGPLTSAELATATTKKEVGKVTISFTQAPASADTRSGRTTSLTDSVVLRFNSTESGAKVVNEPCT